MQTGMSRILKHASLLPALLPLTIAVNVPHVARAASASFTPIGNLDSSVDPTGSFATGDTPAAMSAARWTRLTGFIELAGQPPGTPSQANGISSDGRIIVGSLNDEAFRWSEKGRFLILRKLSGACRDGSSG